MKTNSLGWKIFGLLVSIFLILGGLSGEMVLRGTHSSAALVAVGFIFLVWDIYALATHRKNRQTFDEPARLKRAGVMLIVASGMIIPATIYSLIMYEAYEMSFLPLLMQYIAPLAALILLLIAGIFLLSETTIEQPGEKGRYAFILLLAAVVIHFIQGIFILTDFISHTDAIEWKFIPMQAIYVLLNLLLALLATCILFFRQNKTLLRSAAILVIVFAGLSLLWRAYDLTNFAGRGDIPALTIFLVLFNTIAGVLLAVAFIVLAAALYPRKAQPAAIESSSDATPKNETAATTNDSGAGVAETQKQPKLRSLGKEVKGQYTYDYYAASSAEEAKQFLASCEVTKPLYYIQVETPNEGVWGLDKDGLYLVNLLPFQTNLSLAQCEGRYTSFPFSAIVMASKGITDNFVCDVVCGSCGHEWKDALRVKNKTIVRCPKCKKYNSVDTNNINVM